MARVWVLDTATKGTGASMVPLESTLTKPAPSSDRPYVVPKRARSKPKPPEPRKPPRFKVVDVMSGQVLAEGADARTTVDLLRDVRSVNHVRIYVWRPKDAVWRLLRLDEQRKLWSLRAAPPAGA
jgi:hypothetical protein